MKIMKFGGSVLTDEKSVDTIVLVIKESLAKEGTCIVVSAFLGATDSILEIAQKACNKDKAYEDKLELLEARHKALFSSLCPQSDDNFLNLRLEEFRAICDGIYSLGELSEKVKDRLLSFGPICSAYILNSVCAQEGIDTVYTDTSQLCITDDLYGMARVDLEKTADNMSSLEFSRKSIRIFPGSIGRTTKGFLTSLGRNGSDLTATLLAWAHNAEKVELWTDVNGVMAADHKLVEGAITISHMSYQEAMELSFFGARLIHPPAMQPAIDKGIPIFIKNVFNPEHEGTIISCEPKGERTGILTGISTISEVSFVRLEGSGMIGSYGVAGRLFGALASLKINLIMISQGSSEHSICFAILPPDWEKAKKAIEEEFSLEISRKAIEKPIVEEGMCVLAVVGENMRKKPGIAGRLFGALGSEKINVVAFAQGSSERSISLVIQRKDEKNALNVLYKEFF